MNTPDTALPHTGSIGRGILWMLLTMLLFVGMDTIAKYLTQFYPVLQVSWARFFFHGVWVMLYLGPRLRPLAVARRPGLQILRGGCMLATTLLFFAGLHLLPLANASALMLVGPLMVTALSVPLLGETVGIRRWASVVVGFMGAMVIVRPGSGVFQLAALLPLAAAAFYALYQVITRKLSHIDQPMTTLLYTVSVGVPVTTLLLPWFWVTPDLIGWLLMIGVGLLGGVSHFTLIKAFENAPAAVLTPFSYSNLVWATLLGFLVFSELPDQWTVVGAIIIVSSGLYIFHREQVRRQDR